MKLTLSTTIKGIAVDLQITGDNGTVATALLARVIEAARMEEELIDDEGDDEILASRALAAGAVVSTEAFGVALGGVIAHPDDEAVHCERLASAPALAALGAQNGTTHS